MPKQIALRNPERIACVVAPAMTLLASLSAPVVWLLDRSGRLVLALLGHAKAKPDTVNDEEIHVLIADAETAGVLEPEERSMIAGVMRLGDRQVRAVMTQRLAVNTIDVRDDIATMRRKNSRQARIRVSSSTTAQPTGSPGSCKPKCCSMPS